MTARIDLAELERLANGGVLDGTVRIDAIDLLALISAVRALREAEELIADMLPYCMEGWDWKYGQYWNDEHAKVRAALAAFDFKEETK